MSLGSANPDVDTFITRLERELHEKKLTLLDSEILGAVEAKRATRDQICAWAKAFHAATRHGRMVIGNFYANAPDDDELRRELAENIYEEETGRISGVGTCHMQVFEFLLDALREKTLAFAPVAKNVWNGHGTWNEIGS